MSDSTITETEFHPSVWNNITWGLGYRTNGLGEYLLKLGDRIQGNKPMGTEEACNLGLASGLVDGLRLSFQSTGRVGGLLTAILKKYNLTTEELAAETGIAVDRVRELQDDAVADPEEVHLIGREVFHAVRDEEDRRTAEFHQRWAQDRCTSQAVA
jgi:hypothetical protein